MAALSIPSRPSERNVDAAAQGRANAVYETISDADLLGEIRRRYSNQPSLVVLAMCERYETLAAELARVREIHRSEQRRSAERLRECLESK